MEVNYLGAIPRDISSNQKFNFEANLGVKHLMMMPIKENHET